MECCFTFCKGLGYIRHGASVDHRGHILNVGTGWECKV
jgi:hypothetical protein